MIALGCYGIGARPIAEMADWPWAEETLSLLMFEASAPAGPEASAYLSCASSSCHHVIALFIVEPAQGDTLSNRGGAA